MKKTIALILLLIITALSSACDNSSNIKTIDINISAGEDYKITEENALETTLNTISVSSDNTVAELRQGKYICGLRPGNTLIKVTQNNKVTNYNVTVTHGNSGTRNYGGTDEVPENDIYFGYGFNLLENGECDQENIIGECVFDWEALYNSGKINCDNSEYTEYKSYSGSTVENFTESYSKKDTVKVSVSIGFWKFKTNIYDKTISQIKSGTTNELKIKNINQLYWKWTTAKYFMSISQSELKNYLKPDVNSSLMGTDGTSVADFIEKYGTHIIIGGDYGGFLESNLIVPDNIFDSKVDYAGLLKDAFCNIALKKYHSDSYYTPLNGTYIFSRYIGDMFTSVGPNMEIAHNSYYNFFSSETIFISQIYNDWIDGMSHRDEYGICLAYLSPTNSQSLVPVWELIDTSTEEGQKRKEEFIKYIEDI